MEVSDWILSGGGYQAESYLSASRPDLILKLFSPLVGVQEARGEYDMNRAALSVGVATPEALEFVKRDDRYGIVYRRIQGKKSFCTLAGEKPELIDDLARRLAGMIRDLHSRRIEPEKFPSALDFYRQIFESSIGLDESTRSLMRRSLEEASEEDSDALLHGDFHYGNAITDGQKDYFIDFGNLSVGNPDIDIAMFYFVTHFGSEEVIMKNFHLTVRQAMDFWNAFKLSYYGKDVSDRELIGHFRKYIFLKLLWMRSLTGNAPFVTTLIGRLSSDCCLLEDRTV